MLEAAEVVNGAKKFFNRSMCCPEVSIARTSERNATARSRYLGMRGIGLASGGDEMNDVKDK